jgi:hypothetical protein
MIRQKCFFLRWVAPWTVLGAVALLAEADQPSVQKPPLAAFSPDDLIPPTVHLDANTPTAGSQVATISVGVTPAADQSIIDDLLEVRRRVGGVTSSSSRFQAELIRLIQADRQRSADAGGKNGPPPLNLTAAAAEAPQPRQLRTPSSDASPGDPQRGALQIAMLRALAEELEGLANQLEREDSFTAADALRERSVQFREQARRLWAALPAAREALKQLPTVTSGSPLDLSQPPTGDAPTVTLPSVPVPVPDPPEPPAAKPKAKR